MAQLKDLLAELAKIEGVLAALVVARDGLVIEGMAAEDVDVEAVGAIVSSHMATAESTGGELAKGKPRALLIEYDQGLIAVGPAGPDALLVVVGNGKCNLGRLRLEMKRNSDLASGLV